MLRRIAALVAALIVASSFAVASPSVARAENRFGCEPLPNNYQVGFSDGGGTVWAVRATIQLGAGADLCSGATPKSTSFWVSMTPHPSMGANYIAQVGIVKCSTVIPDPNDACYSRGGQVFYFYSVGGCNFITPKARSLGLADYGAHVYFVAFGVSSIYFYIDGVMKKSVPYTDSAVNCWANGSRAYDGAWSAERFNRGDSWGTSGYPTYFRYAERRYSMSGSAPWYRVCCVTGAYMTEPSNDPGMGFLMGVANDSWKVFSHNTP